MFDNLDDDSDCQKLEKKNEADLDFEEDSDEGEFNANELLNFSDYQNKRNNPVDLKNNSTTKSVFDNK